MISLRSDTRAACCGLVDKVDGGEERVPDDGLLELLFTTSPIWMRITKRQTFLKRGTKVKFSFVSQFTIDRVIMKVGEIYIQATL